MTSDSQSESGGVVSSTAWLGDKERLDWLEKFHAVVILGGDGRTEWIHKLTANCGSLRASIDAAMSPNDQAHPQPPKAGGERKGNQ